MEPREYVDARWSALVRAAVLLGASEEEAPRIVREVLAANRRRIRRAADPDPLVHRALVAAVPGGERTAFGAEADLESRRAMLIETDEAVSAPPLGPAPAPPARRSRRSRRLVLLAGGLVATVLVAIGVVVATGGRGDERPDDRLRADQVPSLFGYDADAARTMLAARGLDVTLEPFRACEVQDRVIATDPPTGTTYAAGDPITVYTSVPADVACLTDYQDIATAWQVVDFLNGRGSAPPFARRVVVYVGDGTGEVVDDARDLGQWADTGVPTAVRRATDRVALVADDPVTYAVPSLTVHDTAPSPGCGAPEPPVAGTDETLSFTIGAPADRTSCPLRVDLFRHGGVIDAVVLYPSLS